MANRERESFHFGLSFEKLICRSRFVNARREKIEWCFFFSIDSEKMNAAKIAAGSLPQRARCISGSTLPRILRTRTCGRQGEKFIESRPPKAFPVNRCARGRLFKRIFTKAVSPSELCLDEPRSCYLSLSLLFPFMNLWKFIAKLGIGVVSFCFDGVRGAVSWRHAFGRSMSSFVARWLGESLGGYSGILKSS